MTIEQTISHISQLPIEDQLRIKTVWDQMGKNAATSPTESQQAELNARLSRYREDSDSALTESELKEKLRNRRDGT